MEKTVASGRKCSNLKKDEIFLHIYYKLEYFVCIKHFLRCCSMLKLHVSYTKYNQVSFCPVCFSVIAAALYAEGLLKNLLQPCHSRKSTGVTDNINVSSLTVKYPRKTFQRNSMHTIRALERTHLRGMQPSLINVMNCTWPILQRHENVCC